MIALTSTRSPGGSEARLVRAWTLRAEREKRASQNAQAASFREEKGKSWRTEALTDLSTIRGSKGRRTDRAHDLSMLEGTKEDVGDGLVVGGSGGRDEDLWARRRHCEEIDRW